MRHKENLQDYRSIIFLAISSLIRPCHHNRNSIYDRLGIFHTNFEQSQGWGTCMRWDTNPKTTSPFILINKVELARVDLVLTLISIEAIKQN